MSKTKDAFVVSIVDPQKYVRLYEYTEGSELIIMAHAANVFGLPLNTMRLMTVDKVISPTLDVRHPFEEAGCSHAEQAIVEEFQPLLRR